MVEKSNKKNKVKKSATLRSVESTPDKFTAKSASTAKKAKLAKAPLPAKGAKEAKPTKNVEEVENVKKDADTTSSKKKSAPTPKRSVAEAANKRPLVQKNDKSAAKRSREQEKAQRDKEYKALQTNDEANLPPRDQGEVRKYIRQFVDARFSLAEFFIIGAFITLLGSAVLNGISFLGVSLLLIIMYAYLVLLVIDFVLLWRKLRSKLIDKFGVEGAKQKGNLYYALTRATQMRRGRLPKPLEKKRGVWPE